MAPAGSPRQSERSASTLRVMYSTNPSRANIGSSQTRRSSATSRPRPTAMNRAIADSLASAGPVTLTGNASAISSA